MNGRYELFCGDCLDILPALEPGSIDAVITDPPYGLNFGYLSYDDTKENLNSLIDRMMPDLKRVSKRVIITPGQSQIPFYPPFDWIGAVTWNTTGSFGALGYSQWMPYLFYGKDINGFGSINGVLKSDSFRLNGGGGVGFQRGEKINHPCPKPLNIIEYFILRFSHPGDLILDPFMGSGTTGVAAVKNGRNFIGIELDSNYFQIAQERIKNAAGDFVITQKEKSTGQTSIFERLTL